MKTRSHTEASETLALDALAYLAGAEGELSRFVETSGIEPAELRARAGEAHVLRAVVEFMLSDDQRLLAFCGARRIDPKHVHLALHSLDGAS